MHVRKSLTLVLVVLISVSLFATLVYAVTKPAISVQSSAGGVTVQGNYWLNNVPVSIYVDVEDASHKVTQTTPFYGNLYASFPIDGIAFGTHTVIAVQGATKAMATFDLCSTSPPDDRLLNPINGIASLLQDGISNQLQTVISVVTNINSAVGSIENKLDVGGSFYNFVNTWFGNIDSKISDVGDRVSDVESKLYDIEQKVDGSEATQILAYYDGNYVVTDEVVGTGPVLVPNTHIYTDKPVLFTVSISVSGLTGSDLYILQSNSIEISRFSASGGNWQRESVTFGGDYMSVDVIPGTDISFFDWHILVQGAPGTVVTVAG